VPELPLSPEMAVSPELPLLPELAEYRNWRNTGIGGIGAGVWAGAQVGGRQAYSALRAACGCTTGLQRVGVQER